MHVVELRRLGRRLGCEKIILRQGRMQMQFVSNPNSAFYKSKAFGKIIDYIQTNVRNCTLREKNGKRQMLVGNITSVDSAVAVLQTIDKM